MNNFSMSDLQYLQILETTESIPADEYNSNIDKALKIPVNSKNVIDSKVKFIKI